MYWDAKIVKPLSEYRIHVEVQDGRKGIFDMKPYLDRGVFRELKDIHYFNRSTSCLGRLPGPTGRTSLPRPCWLKWYRLALSI